MYQLTQDQKRMAIQKTRDCIDEYNATKNMLSAAYPEVRFDIKGTTAGMYVYRHSNDSHVIRYNEELFAKYWEDMFNDTVPHEVAHYLDKIHFKRTKPHGKNWKSIMLALGVQPTRCHSYSMEGISVRQKMRFVYKCPCCRRRFHLTKKKHEHHQTNAPYGPSRGYFCKCKKLGEGSQLKYMGLQVNIQNIA